MESKVSLWLAPLIRFNKLPKPIYQTECTKPNLLNQICSLDLNQIYQAKSIETNLPNQTYKPESYKIESTNQNVLNVKNQIYQPKSIQSNIQKKSIQSLLSNQT